MPQATTELSERAMHNRCEALDRELQIGRTRALDAFAGGASLAFELGEALAITAFSRVPPPSHLSQLDVAAPNQQHPSPQPQRQPLPLPLPSQSPINPRLLGHQPLPPRTLAPRAETHPCPPPSVSVAACATVPTCTSIAACAAPGTAPCTAPDSSALVPTASADGASVLCQSTQLLPMPPPPSPPPPSPPQLRVLWECATSSCSDLTAPTCSSLGDSTLGGYNTRAELATPTCADAGAAEATVAAFLAANLMKDEADVSVVRRLQWDASTTSSAVPPQTSLVAMDGGDAAPLCMPHLGCDTQAAVVDEMLEFLDAAAVAVGRSERDGNQIESLPDAL